MKSRNPNDTTPKIDIYRRITDRIIADLEQGVRPWLKPWSVTTDDSGLSLPLRHNGTQLPSHQHSAAMGRGVRQGLHGPELDDLKQAQQLGAQVRQGEKGALVV